MTSPRMMIALAAACCGLFASARAAENILPVNADLVLAGGRIFDGTRTPGIVGDVAIRGGEIVAVGTFPHGEVDQVIDCQHLVVCPGFIDLHTHSDKPLVAAETRGNVNYLLQGCTTVVTGNCGYGRIDVDAYFQTLEEHGAGTNVIHLLPHGSLREAVLGSENRIATEAEIAQLCQRATEALQHGAWGLSTGLNYVPGAYASRDEIVALAATAGRFQGLYVSHIRSEGRELLDAIDEALEIGRRGQIPVHISHLKSSGKDAWGLVRAAVEQIEKARAAGQTVTADQYPYTASSTSLAAMLVPAAARSGGSDGLAARLTDAEQAAKIREHIVDALKRRGGDTIRIAKYRARQAWVGKSLAEIAAAEQRDPADIVLEIVRQGGASAISFGMQEDDVRFVMQKPWVATASDGRAYLPGVDRPHPRYYGTFPRKIGRYAIVDGVITLEAAIHSATGLPAEILGLADRGRIRPGAIADITIFDPAAFRDEATYEDPHRYAAGVRYVLIGGIFAVHRGTPTGALLGKPIRHPVPAELKGP